MKIQGFIKGGSKFKLPMIFARPRTMTYAEYQLLTEEERQGEIVIKDYPTPEEGDYVEVVADGVKTYGALIAELDGLVNFSKLNKNTKIVIPNGSFTEVFPIVRFSDSGAYFARTMYGSSSEIDFQAIRLGDVSSARYIGGAITSSSTGVSNSTSTVPTSGTKIILYYNKTQTLELGTLAENCMMSDGSNVQDRLGGDFTLAGTITAIGGNVTIPATANEVFIFGTIRTGTYNGSSAFCKRTSGDITAYSVSLGSSDASILWESIFTLDFVNNTVTFTSANKVIASTTTINPYYRVFYR